jgi:hypothetical protein
MSATKAVQTPSAPTADVVSAARKRLSLVLALHDASGSKKNVICQFTQRQITLAADRSTSMRQYIAEAQAALEAKDRISEHKFIISACTYPGGDWPGHAVKLERLLDLMLKQSLNEAQVSIGLLSLAANTLDASDATKRAAEAWAVLLTDDGSNDASIVAKTVSVAKATRAKLGL